MNVSFLLLFITLVVVHIAAVGK